MSDNDTSGTEVTGTVSQFYPNEDRENTPPAFILDGDRYSVMADEDADRISENVTIRFRYRKKTTENRTYRNVVPESVEVLGVQQPTEGSVKSSEGVQKNGDMHMFSMDDARIMAQSITRSAVLFHQDREDSTVDDVEETAERFADLQSELVQQLRGVPLKGEA